MAVTRSKKEELVKALKEKILKSKALVFARFHKLSVAKASGFRRDLRKVDSEYTVAKKTLLKIALKASGKEVAEKFEGEVGVITGYGDELATFKNAMDFSKKEKEAFQVLGGIFEGKVIDAKTAKALGMIPSREALIAQLMSVLLGNTRKLVYVLDQISKSQRPIEASGAVAPTSSG